MKTPVEQTPEGETTELELTGTVYHTARTKRDDSSYREEPSTEPELRTTLQHMPLSVDREERKVLQYDSENSENDDVSERRYLKEKTKTDAKAGATRHPSRHLNGTSKWAIDPADAKVGSTQHPPFSSNIIDHDDNLDRIPSCRRILRLNSDPGLERSRATGVPKQKPACPKRQTKQRRRQDKSEQRRVKRQNRRTGGGTIFTDTRPKPSAMSSHYFPVTPVESVDTAQKAPQRMTNQEVLEKLNRKREDYAKIKQQRGVSDPAIRALSEEFDEINQSFIEWENQFLHRINTSVCPSAEASFVREETAQRCRWQIRGTQRRIVLTGTYGAVATGIVNIPIRLGKQTLGLRLFVSPHVNDSLVLGQDVVSRISVCQGRLLLTLNNGEIIDTLTKNNPFRMIFEATYVDEEDNPEDGDWRAEELVEEAQKTEQRPDVHSTGEAIAIVKSRKTPERGAAPSIIEDSLSVLTLLFPPLVCRDDTFLKVGVV